MILPDKVSIPLVQLARRVNRLPILDYASCVLNNWVPVDGIDLSEKQLELKPEDVRILYTFTGLDSEKWFYAIHVCIEFEGRNALSSMLQMQDLFGKHHLRATCVCHFSDATAVAVLVPSRLMVSLAFESHCIN